MEPQSLYPRFRSYYKGLVPLFQKPKVAAYTMLTLSFFTMTIFGIFAIRPTLATIAQLRKKIVDQERVSEAMTAKITQLRQAEIAYQNIRPDLHAVFETLPESPKAAHLLGKLNRSLAQHNIRLTILQFSPFGLTTPESTASASSVMGFTLTAEASYSDILNFITLLSQADRILTIDTVNISPSTPLSGGAISQSDTLTLVLKGKAYVLWRED